MNLSNLWRITCHDVRDNRIILGEQKDDFELFNDHVLLWSYNQPVSSLTFNRVNLDVDACHVVSKLYKKHKSLVGSWIPFDMYFKPISRFRS